MDNQLKTAQQIIDETEQINTFSWKEHFYPNIDKKRSVGA